MALAETILRKIHKLGIIPRIIRILPVFSLLLSLSSVAWLLVLPLDGQYRNTYISENALMPGQVHSYFRESEWNILRGYREAVHELEEHSIEDKNEKVEMWLNDIGLKTAHFLIDATGDILYGIMRAPRGDNTESMVLAVPWLTHDGRFNEGGIATSLALMRYFTKMSIWSKDIIIVIPKNGHVPLRKWVEAYHTSLELTAGSIEAAIVLEFPGTSDYFEYYELFYEGLNGQLPNLDLLNTLNTVGQNENIKCSIQGVPPEEIYRRTYASRLKVLIKGIASLALAGSSRQSPGCEAFSGWQIQSFTLVARGTSGHDITQFGRLVDSTFRSVNNLLERFHQSFFFYLMLSPWNFVSIGTYLPSAILNAVSFAISAVGCLLNGGVRFDDFTKGLTKVLGIITLLELFCFLNAVTLPYLVLNSKEEEEAIISILLNGYTFFSLIICLLPNFNSKLRKYHLEKSIAYMNIALAIFIISLLITVLLVADFSLALLVGILNVPLTFIQPIITADNLQKLNEKNKSEKENNIQRLMASMCSRNTKIAVCLFFSNPVFIIYLIGNFFYPQNGTAEFFRCLITSWNELQSWSWFVVSLGWFPAWSLVAISCILGNFEIDQTELNLKKNQ